jgi:hypothetical protein
MIKRIAIRVGIWIVVLFAIYYSNATLLMYGHWWSIFLAIGEIYLFVRIYGAIRKRNRRNNIPEHDDNDSGYKREAIPTEVKRFVIERDRHRCVKCGSPYNLEFDHIIPVAEHGSNTANNIQILCKDCNRSKGKNIE